MELPELKIGFWERLNGSKRNIGWIVQGVGYLATLAHPAGRGLVILGGLFTGVGVAHDLGKKSSYGDPGKFGWKDLWQFISDIIQKVLRRQP